MKEFIGFDFVVHPSANQPGLTYNEERYSNTRLKDTRLKNTLDRFSNTVSQKSYSLPQRSRHHWSIEEEAVLCVLVRWFIFEDAENREKIIWSDVRRIFWVYFVVDLNSSDDRKLLTIGAFTSRIHQIRKQAAENQAWRNVYMNTNFEDSYDQWSSTKVDLEIIAAELGIFLLRRQIEDKAEVPAKSGDYQRSRKRKRFYESRYNLGLDTDLNSMDYDIVSEPKVKKGYLLTPPPSASKAKASNYNPALTSADKSRAKSTLLHSSFHIRSPSLSPYHSLCQPKRSDVKIFSQDLLHEYTFHVTKDWGLAFRFYDQNSNGVNGPTGFRAGRFQETNTRSNSPPDRRSKAFRDAAIIHLTPLSKPSGFISIFESPLPAIHRGLRSYANPHVAVIDLYQLAQAQKPKCPSLYPAASVIKQLKQRDKSEENSIPPYYSGRGEWIVWESIKRQAVLATFSVQDLRVYLRNHPTLEHVLRLTGIQRASNSREYNKFIINTQLPLSRASGHAIGHFLAWTGLDEKFLDAAALKIARGWKFFGCNHVQRQNQYLAGARIGRQEFLQDTRNPKARSSSSGSKKHEKHTCIAVDDDFDSKRRHIEAVLRLYNKSEECGNNVYRASDINIRLKRRYTPAVLTPSSISKEHEIHTYPAKDGEFVSRRRHINALLELGSTSEEPVLTADSATDDESTLTIRDIAALPELSSTIEDHEQDTYPATDDEFILNRRRIAAILMPRNATNEPTKNLYLPVNDKFASKRRRIKALLGLKCI